jgi:hypothetical protein
VRRWQELLLAAGYELPQWGSDGGFGQETEDATNEAQRDLKAEGLYHGALDCKVGEKTLDAMHAHLKRGRPTQPKPMTMVDGIEVWDYRGKLVPPGGARPDKGNRWEKLSGVVLHRTACRLGENPERYFEVNAHMHVTRGGRIVLCHPWDLHIWHGHRPSLWTLGIEFDGNPEGYPAKDGKSNYYWKPGGGPDPITDAQVAAGQVLLKLILQEFRAHEREFKYVYAHRQGSDQRECDPGWEAWQKIAVPWMDQTGAIPGDDNGFGGTTFGSGFQIPQSWDPRSPTKGFRVQ